MTSSNSLDTNEIKKYRALLLESNVEIDQEALVVILELIRLNVSPDKIHSILKQIAPACGTLKRFKLKSKPSGESRVTILKQLNHHYGQASSSIRFVSTRVAIVGSGPAGFYTARKLLKNPDIHVDIYEKLPVPFGLVRYGVAPDHQEVKNVINSFTATANEDRVNFYGNVTLGTDIGLDDLVGAYHAVVLSYGSAQDKLLNIEGEETAKNLISARRFVGWYNGLPEDKDIDIDLDCDTACIIGQGNVALDCARILLRPSNIEKTDITTYAQQVISKSKIRRIYIVGRRGPAQVSFTIKELRELIKMDGVNARLEPDTIFDDVDVTSTSLNSLPRHRRRLTELLLGVAVNKTSSSSGSSRTDCVFKFLSKPHKIKADPETGLVSQLGLQLAEYPNKESFLNQTAQPTYVDKYETIDCGLIIRSIGYKAVPVDKNLPMDQNSNAILNTNGRIHGFRSLYCSGWLATGASGVIAGTLNSSQVTGQSILDDISTKQLPNLDRKKPGYESIDKLLRLKQVQVVHFNDWLRIDRIEKGLGEILGKSREKLVDVDKLLEAARGESATGQ